MQARAIVTLNIGDREEGFLSKPFFYLYCQRYNLDLIVINEQKLKLNPNRRKPRLGIHLEKFQIAELFEHYERIAYLDSDILIHPDTPDLFEEVAPDCLGCVFEDLGEEEWKRREEWDKAEKLLGKIEGGPHRYFNAGVMVFSRSHQELFNLDLGIPGGRWPDQTFLNYHSRKLEMPLMELSAKFNFLPHFPGWHDVKIRTHQHIVHYAGRKNKAAMRSDASLFRKAWGF